MEEKNNGVDRSSENTAKEINATELLRQLKENIKLNPVTTNELEDSFSVAGGDTAPEKNEEAEMEFLDQSVKQDQNDEEASKGQRFKISKRKKSNPQNSADATSFIATR